MSKKNGKRRLPQFYYQGRVLTTRFVFRDSLEEHTVKLHEAIAAGRVQMKDGTAPPNGVRLLTAASAWSVGLEGALREVLDAFGACRRPVYGGRRGSGPRCVRMHRRDRTSSLRLGTYGLYTARPLV